MNIAKFSVSRPVTVDAHRGDGPSGRHLPAPVDITGVTPRISVVTSWPNVALERSRRRHPTDRRAVSIGNVYEVSSTSSEATHPCASSSTGALYRAGRGDVLQQVQRQRSPNDATLQNPTVYKFDPSQMPS